MHYLAKCKTFITLLALIAGSLITATASFAGTTTYIYDELDRLTEVQLGNGNGIRYEYDEIGNLLSKTPYGSVFTIAASADSGGKISPSGTSTVASGSSITYKITPLDTSYKITAVNVDGISQGEITSYTFNNITANHTITANFSNALNITSTAGNGGSISPTSASLSPGGSQTFTITPQTGYHIVDVTVDGASQGAITSYPFNNVTTNHTIAATFIGNTYTITATAGAGGTISPATTTVNYGESQTFTITPSTNYNIVDVLVDGVSKGAVTSYPFSNITANHTIEASFATFCVNTTKNSRTGTTYTTIQAAYNDTALQAGDTILVAYSQYIENFTASKAVSITIDGGYKCDFSTNPYMTVIKGAPRISNGTVKMKNIRVSN